MNQPSQVNGEKTAVFQDANRNGFSGKDGISNVLDDTATPTIRIHNEDSQDASLNQQQYFGSTPPQSFRRRCDSMTAREDDDQNESKVLVIYTGGTIGMMRNDEDSKYMSDYLFVSIVWEWVISY